MIAVSSEIDIKQLNALCEQKVQFVNVKPGGSQSNHCGLIRFRIFQEPLRETQFVQPAAYAWCSKITLKLFHYKPGRDLRVPGG